MPKNYKTYSKPGSFSEFQIKTPDQTEKFNRQTQKQIRGRERAQQALERQREIHQRTQRLVNSFEEENRDVSFQMQTKERQSYRDALTRDYKTAITNLDNQNKAQQTNLENISAFSTTAANLVGQYLKAEEEKKVAAAHDIISRTGVTYDEMLAFQKMNDNLTRAEFASQDAVQEILGPGADSSLIDAFFTVYQNRNTKRWFEHKQLFKNTLNGFPDFLEEHIKEVEQQTGEKITDFDAVLDQAKRKFMELHFAGKARPEVLSGLGVYAKLDELVNTRRSHFLTEKRQSQKKELERDRHNAFLQVLSEEGPAGILRINGTNPSYQKRASMVAAIKLGAEGGGAFGVTVGQIDAILRMPAGGSNGKTFQEAFPGSAAELEAIKQSITKKEKQAEANEKFLRQQEFDDFLRGRADAYGTDGTLTLEEVDQIKREAHLAYPGMSSDVFKQITSLTPDGKLALDTELINNRLALRGRLTVEQVMLGKYLTPEARNTALKLAQFQEEMSKDPLREQHHDQLEADFLSNPQVTQARKINPKANDINYTLYIADLHRKYDTLVNQLASVKDANPAQARNDALKLIKADMEADIKQNHTPRGMKQYVINGGKPLSDLERSRIEGLATTGDDQLKKIKAIAQDTSLSDADAARQAAALMNHPEIEKALMNYTSPSFTMPPAIVVYADAINRTPLFALQQLAPLIGDGTTKLDVDRINKEMKVRYQQYIDTPYTPIRNTYRTPERTGRANIGDNKSGATAPIRPSMFKVVQYVSADPAIRGKDDGPGGRIYYEAQGHGGQHYHNHYEFESRAQAAQAKALFEARGFRVTSYLRPDDTGSAHSYGTAIDVAPPLNLPYTDEAEAAWSASANAVIGFNPLENE